MKKIGKIVAMVAIVTIGTIGTTRAQGFSLEWHGFVNPHYYADSRSVVGGREDMMLFYPKPVLLDSLGNDLNDGWQADMLAITARLGLKINGPEMLGAKTSAYIEGDFTGSTNATINDLRLRHAYNKSAVFVYTGTSGCPKMRRKRASRTGLIREAPFRSLYYSF